MAQRLVYERFLWFHDQARKGAYPNAGRLPRTREDRPSSRAASSVGQPDPAYPRG